MYYVILGKVAGQRKADCMGTAIIECAIMYGEKLVQRSEVDR